jgi:hypothetical protein
MSEEAAGQDTVAALFMPALFMPALFMAALCFSCAAQMIRNRIEWLHSPPDRDVHCAPFTSNKARVTAIGRR